MITNPHATRILCYGDSNTWGADPELKGNRFNADTRWTGVAQTILGDSFDIIEEGLSSRTTDLEYGAKPGRNGKPYFVPCLETHNPLDIIIVMLGTNDLKIEFGPRSAAEIATALKGYIDDIHARAKTASGVTPRIVLMSPAIIDQTKPGFAIYKERGFYNEQSASISRELAAATQALAMQQDCDFLDAASVASVGSDAIHITKQGHAALGRFVAQKVTEVTT